jgi:hypothetical protein
MAVTIEPSCAVRQEPFSASGALQNLSGSRYNSKRIAIPRAQSVYSWIAEPVRRDSPAARSMYGHLSGV